MARLLRLALAAGVALSATGGVLVWDQGVHVSVPGVTRPTVVARVVEVLSGDTVDVSLDKKRLRLTLAGIEAPRVEAVDGVTDCLGPESRDHLRELLPNGQRFHLRNVTVHEDGSLTATAHTVLNQVDREMVAAGLATPSELATALSTSAPDPGTGLMASMPLLAARPFEEGFTERVEAQRRSDDASAILTAAQQAGEHTVGLYDPAVACTLPGHVADIGRRISEAAMLPTFVEELAQVDWAERSARLDAASADLEAFAGVTTTDPAQFPLRPFGAGHAEKLATLIDAERLRITQARDSFMLAQQKVADHVAEQAAQEAERAARAARAQEEERRRAERSGGGLGGTDSGAGTGEGQAGGVVDPGATGTGTGSGADGTTGADQDPPPASWVPPNDPAADTSRIRGLTFDGYEGCRAYSGFPPDAVDEQNRPFRKVDCRTRQPLFPG